VKKHVLIFGIIPGLVWITLMILVLNGMYANPDMKTYDILGFTLMVLVFSLIFFGIREYRNKKLDGIISFGRAFKMGIFMTLVATAVYVIVWMFYYHLFAPDFLDVYADFVLRKASPDEVAEKTKYLDTIRKWYENPFGIALITAIEVLPVGLIVTLISALILRKKKIKHHEA
jgi:hypothetical protein